ncbi:MAG: hypothetical protein FJ399_18650, partial [Verrucomicrobia bacterium]|nr:hypothetical protein [Verrucomicrobiota bacterium]
MNTNLEHSAFPLTALFWCTVLGAASIGASALVAADRPAPPTRQVHLDFHTSEHIPEIGARFDKAQWQAALRAGHVNQINIFAKCHHSWSYYPTKVGRVHPHLKFDLLGAQIAACHEIGVVCPIYYTVGWSATDAEDHPEWLVRQKNGQPAGNWDPKSKAQETKPGFQWKPLCSAASGPYHAHILQQIEEICEGYPVDGFWFDIYDRGTRGCYCTACQARLKQEGVNLADDAAV